MKKILFILCSAFCLAAPARAQQSNTYPVVVSFNSFCCGVPSDTPLVSMIKAFRKQYKIRQVSADKIGPMGREGEYYLAFRLKEFNKTQRTKFIQQLKKTAATMKDNGKAEIRENEEIEKELLSDGKNKVIIKY